MSKYLLAALLCLSSIASFGTARPEVKAAYKANMHIHQETITDRATCSATAIGPQALLTATHCELPTDELEIEGLDKPVKIVGRIRDGKDHSIYLIEGFTFKDTVAVAQNKIEPTDTVFIWGNPGQLTDMYRVGVFSGVISEEDVLLFQLPIYPGDSGAALFAENGTVVEVVSFSFTQQTKDGRSITFAGVWPLSFSQEDIDKAVKFTTPAPVPPKKDSANDTSSNTSTIN